MLGDGRLGSVTFRGISSTGPALPGKLIRNAGSWAPAHTCWTRHSGREAYTVWVTALQGIAMSSEGWEPGSRMMTPGAAAYRQMEPSRMDT